VVRTPGSAILIAYSRHFPGPDLIVGVGLANLDNQKAPNSEPMITLAKTVLLCILPTLAFGQGPVYLQDFKNTWNSEDPVDVAYLRGINLIAKQIDARTEEDILLRSISWAWNDTNKTWQLSNQIINTYNPDHHLIGDIGQQWLSNEWVDQYRTTYVYNEHGLIRLFQYEAWTGLNWELYVRFVHEYDAEKRLSVFIAQDWIGDQWINRYKRLFEYNEYPCYHRETRQYWVDDKWQNAFRYTDYYDDHDLMTTNTMQAWEQDAWQWSMRNLLEYDCYFAPVEIKAQQFIEHHWQDVTAVLLGYDTAGLLISETYHHLQDSNAIDNGWSFQYDAADNMIERAYWKECEPYWQASSRDVFTYDAYNRNTTILHQDYTDYWLNRSFTEYEYLRVTSVTPVDLSDQMKVFPNPVDAHLTITVPERLQGKGTLAIYNAEGKKEMEETIVFEKTNVLPVQHLAPGIYVIRLLSDTASASQLFVKK
jgi:hypothetical protein